MNKKLFIFYILICYSILGYTQGLQIAWQQCFGGTSRDRVFDMVATPGGYLMAGVTASTDGTISYNHGLADAWIVKVNNNGEFLWEKTFGGSSGDSFRRILKCDNNSYYALGSSSSDDGDISYDPYPESSDLWVVKIDSLGNIIWDKIAGGNSDDVVFSAKVTADGGIVALTRIASGSGDISNHFGYYDMWLVKFAANGDIEWDFTLGSDFQDEPGDILLTDDGGFIVCGSSHYLTGVGNISCQEHGWVDAIVVKLDSSRSIEWQQCYGGSDWEIFNVALQTADGYLFGGTTHSSDGQVTGYHGNGDIWIVKTDFFGNIIWEKCFGGSHNEYTFNLYNSSSGYVIIGGTASHDGDVTGNHSLGEYAKDVWIVNIDFDGELISQQCFGGEYSENTMWGTVKVSDHDFVIATQAEKGPSYDIECDIYGYGDGDWWVFEAKDTTVGINSYNSNAIKLEVYPNPADEFVRFDYSNNFSVEEPVLEIFNLQGIVLRQMPLDKKGGTEIWDCSSFSAGMYFYRVISGGQIVGKGKWIIDR